MVDYYLSIGVEHFYITDNNSAPPLQSILHDYINKGLITYRYDTRVKPQTAVYNECIREHVNDAEWIMFFDSDEFLVLKQHAHIKAFLKSYESYGSISIRWYLFGSSGHEKKQPSMIQSYTQRAAQSCHYKTIVQPSRIAQFSVHNVTRHKGNYYTVDKKCRRVEGAFTKYQDHYVTRSREDFADKAKRGGGTNPKPKTWDFFNKTNKEAVIEDRLLLEQTQERK